MAGGRAWGARSHGRNVLRTAHGWFQRFNRPRQATAAASPEPDESPAARRRCVSAACACSPMSTRSVNLAMDELDDLVDGLERSRCARIVRDESLAHALEQMQLHAPAGLAVIGDELLAVRLGMSEIGGALQVEHGRHAQ